MSISFIWYHFFWIGASDEAYVTSGKSGLNFNALDLLISVLSNKAVLAFAYEWIKGDKCCYGTLVEYDADDLQIKLSVLRGGSQSLCIFYVFYCPTRMENESLTFSKVNVSKPLHLQPKLLAIYTVSLPHK